MLDTAAAKTHEPAGRLSDGAEAVARTLRRASVSPGIVGALGCLVDMCAIALALWFVAYASAAGTFSPTTAAAFALVQAFGVAVLSWVLGACRLQALRRFVPATTMLLALVVATATLSGATPSALPLVAPFVLASRGLAAVIAAAAIDFGLTERRAVIVGGGERGAQVMRMLATSGADVRVCGIFDDRDDRRSPAVVRGVPKLGSLADLVTFVRAAEIDTLIVTLPLNADRRIREVLKAVEILPVDVRLSDFSGDLQFRRRRLPPAQDGFINVLSRPLRQRQRLVKRAIEIVAASVAILLLSPLMIATAVAIRLETPGPVIFCQPRHGYNHRPVVIWKFRSMFARDCDPTARRIVTREDPRVTRVGRVIRKFSIDELPQLFNVLKGDLSLVGPRPHVLNATSSRQESFEAIVDGYAARHKVRPGITGWAQIHGWRGEIDDPEALRRRVEYDLFYIENWSVWLDLRILAMTPLCLLDTRRAY